MDTFPLEINSLSMSRGMLDTPEHVHNGQGGQQCVGASEGRFVPSHCWFPATGTVESKYSTTPHGREFLEVVLPFHHALKYPSRPLSFSQVTLHSYSPD